MESFIGLDVEGGNLSLEGKLGAIVSAVKESKDGVKVCLFSDRSNIPRISGLIQNIPTDLRNRILQVNNTHDASLQDLIESLKDPSSGVDMALSAADTGEIGRQSMKLGRISKVMPAISAQLPNSGNGYGRSLFLDVGFDVGKGKTTEQQVNIMVEHAIMASIFDKRIRGLDTSRVGILTNGEEENKGNDLVQVVRDELKKLTKMGYLEYIGYIEGDGITSGEFDILLSDGHTGNIALKTGEGQRKELGSDVSAMFRKNGIIGKIAGLLLCRSLKRLKKENDPNSYSLGLIIGLKGLIGKIHGSADEEGFKNAILQSNQYIGIEREFGVISEIERALIAYRETKKDEV